MEECTCTNYDGRIVTTNTDLTFETATLVWAAGVKGATIKRFGC